METLETEREREREREREMTKRKERREIAETLISEAEEGIDEIRKGEKGFFACYLLVSLSPRHKGHTYIGFTVNPCRRIRQHNGELRSGAWRTKRKRPWEMVLCIYGFPTNVSALQFEWAWQHPMVSLAVRKAAASLTSRSGIAGKIKLAYTMLTLPDWQSLNLTVNFFSTKYTMHSVGCPSLPKCMKIQICPMNELPCYIESDQTMYDEDRDDWNEEEEDCDDGDDNGTALQDSSSNVTVYNRAESWCNTENTTLEQSTQVEDDYLRQSKDRLRSREEDHRPVSCAFNSRTGISSSSINNSFSTEETVEGSELFVLVETKHKLGHSTRQQSPTSEAARIDQSPSNRHTIFSPEDQVIDLSTPNCIVSSCGKRKKRYFPDGLDIIDLTESPIFIQ